MKDQPRIEYRQRGALALGQVVLAAVAGAAAGAAFAFFVAPAPGRESRRRLRDALVGAKDRVERARGEVERLPVAMARATEAAREAFVETLCENTARPER